MSSWILYNEDILGSHNCLDCLIKAFARKIIDISKRIKK